MLLLISRSKLRFLNFLHIKLTQKKTKFKSYTLLERVTLRAQRLPQPLQGPIKVVAPQNYNYRTYRGLVLWLLKKDVIHVYNCILHAGLHKNIFIKEAFPI